MRQLPHHPAHHRKSPGADGVQTAERPHARPAAEIIDTVESDILAAMNAMSRNIGSLSGDVSATGSQGAPSKDLAATSRSTAAEGVFLAVSTEGLAAASGDITTRMDATNQKVRDALSSARGASGMTADLARAVEEMVDIVDTIASIARQTNLLALTATIEAARAGAAGTGFSGVAKDVKTLSEEASKAAKSIRTRIVKLRDNAGATVRSAEKVVSAIHEVQPLCGTMRSAVDEQKASLAELVQRAMDVSTSVQQIGRKAEEIDARTAALAARNADTLTRSLGERFVTVLRHNEAGDRRRHDRYPVYLTGTLRVGAHTLDTHTVDISAGGVLLANLHGIALSPGYTVHMDIERLGRLSARVAAVSAMGLHCAFDHLDLDAEARLGRMLADIEEEYRPLIRVTKQAALQVEAVLDQALTDHRLTWDKLFDTDYRPVPGTEPQQYETAYTQVLDDLLPAVQEPLLVSDNRLVFCVAVDRNGYAPVHNRKHSLPQRPGDLAWNSAYSLNKRIFDDRAGLVAARSSRPFVIQCCTRDMGGGPVMTREIAAPIRVGGRQWGGFRTGYQF